eukprot:4995416-Pyramimonas_sp.AAC.1
MLCIVFQLYNIPADMRKTYENLLIWGIMEGKGKAELVFLIMVEDLEILWKGVGVWDTYEEETLVVRAMLMNMLHDYPGFTATAMQSATGAISGCVACDIRGTYVPALNKTVYARRLQADPEAAFTLKDKDYLETAASEIEVSASPYINRKTRSACCPRPFVCCENRVFLALRAH